MALRSSVRDNSFKNKLTCMYPFRSFCQFYDMQEHSTKVFKEICEALHKFVNSMLAREMSQAHSSTSGNISPGAGPSSPISEKAPTQSGFLYRGQWIPVPNVSQTNIKPI